MAVEQWLYNTLSARPELAGRVWGHVIPADADLPAVVFVYQAGPVSVGVGGRPLLARLRYAVKAVGETESFEDLRPLFEAADAALLAPTASGPALGAVRESYLAFVEFSGPQQIRHLGAVYTIYFAE